MKHEDATSYATNQLVTDWHKYGGRIVSIITDISVGVTTVVNLAFVLIKSAERNE